MKEEKEKIITLFPPVLNGELAKKTRIAIRETRLLAGLVALEKATELMVVNKNEKRI